MRLFLSIIGVILVGSILSGCAGSAIGGARTARVNYEKSVEDYRACLAANSSNVKACEAQRVMMETDERAFNNMSDSLNGLMGGNVTVQQRR
jgi:hypothetical protein